MMSEPRDNIKFIVITASYERPELLKRNIESTRKQNFTNWVQIVVDDGSLDNEVHKIALHYQSLDPRVIFLPLKKNVGCNKARNAALDYIVNNNLSGFITLIDDDDYLCDGALQSAAFSLTEDSTIKWMMTNNIFPDGAKASRLDEYRQLNYITDGICGKLIRGDNTHFIDSDYLQHVRFSEKFKNGQEWYLYTCLSSNCHPVSKNINSKVVEYLDGGLSMAKVSEQVRLESTKLKISTLEGLVSKKQLSKQKLLLVRELIKYDDVDQALVILKSLLPYQWMSLRYYRYLVKALCIRVIKYVK